MTDPAAPDSETCQLIFSSRLTTIGPGGAQDSGPDGVRRLLEQTRVRNASMGITGVALFSMDHIAELLEGPRAAVDELFAMLEQDTRHDSVRLVGTAPVTTRQFSDWTSGYLPLSTTFRTIMRDRTGQEEFDVSALSFEAVRDLLVALARLYAD